MLFKNNNLGVERIIYILVPALPTCLLKLFTLAGRKEKAMAPHSSTLAWKIPWTEEPGRLQSMGSQSRTQLSDFTFTFHFHALEKEMANHSSVLVSKIPGTGELGGLPSMESHRIGSNWSDFAAVAAGRPGVLQSMGLQRVGHDWAMELNPLGNGTQNTAIFRRSSWVQWNF